MSNYDELLEEEMERLFNLAILRAEDACYQDDEILSLLSEGLSILNLLVVKNNSVQYPKRPYLSDEKLFSYARRSTVFN